MAGGSRFYDWLLDRYLVKYCHLFHGEQAQLLTLAGLMTHKTRMMLRKYPMRQNCVDDNLRFHYPILMGHDCFVFMFFCNSFF